MTLRAVLTDALLTTLAAPATWPMTLATFLLRGGVALVVLPIVVLPSPVGLGNLLAPTLIDVAFQGLTPPIAILVAVLVGAFVVWVVVGGLVAAELEAASVWIVLRDDVRQPGQIRHARAPAGKRVPARLLVARLIAHLPTAIGLIWASARLVAVAYRELTSPFDVATPIVLRVVRGAPDALVTVGVLWILGEVVGALATRRILAADGGVWPGIRGALSTLVHHPIGVLGAFLVPLAGLLIVLGAAGMAASASWTAVQAAMQRPENALWATLLVVVFVSLWVVGLALVAVISAWRSATWTLLAPNIESMRMNEAIREPG